MSHKLLIIGPAWVGDMVMAQSLFKFLKARDPSVRLEVLAPAWTLPLLRFMPEVAEGMLLPFDHGELKLKARFLLAKTLRKEAYRQAIILPHSFKSALIPFFAKIPIRTGFRGEGRYGLLTDLRILNKKRYPLMVEQFLSLVLLPGERLPKNYPRPLFQVTPMQQQKVLSDLALPAQGRPILGLCPGAEYGPAKRWKLEYFAEMANHQLAAGWEVWLFGSANDRFLTERIMQLCQQRCVNFAGKLSLQESVCLMSLVAGVITNDSGLMHVAAALNKPLVALYGPTSPHFTPPLSASAEIFHLSLDCQPCFKRKCPLHHHRCMQDLTVDRVQVAVAKWSVQ